MSGRLPGEESSKVGKTVQSRLLHSQLYCGEASLYSNQHLSQLSYGSHTDPLQLQTLQQLASKQEIPLVVSGLHLEKLTRLKLTYNQDPEPEDCIKNMANVRKSTKPSQTDICSKPPSNPTKNQPKELNNSKQEFDRVKSGQISGPLRCKSDYTSDPLQTADIASSSSITKPNKTKKDMSSLVPVNDQVQEPICVHMVALQEQLKQLKVQT